MKTGKSKQNNQKLETEKDFKDIRENGEGNS